MRKPAKKGTFRLGNTYLLTPRELFYLLYSDNEYERITGRILLTVAFHSYFSDSMVRYKNRTLPCMKGEWITSFQEISSLLGLDRRTVGNYIRELVDQQLLSVINIPGGGCRIRFDAYLRFQEEIRKSSPTVLPDIPGNAFGEGLDFPSENKLAFADGSYL